MFIQNLSRKGKELEEVLLVRLYNYRELKENCYSSLSLEKKKKAGDTMNKKQFGPLDIALTKRRARVHTESIKKRKRTRRSIAGKIV